MTISKSKTVIISFLIMLSLGGIISCSRVLSDNETDVSEEGKSWSMFQQNAQHTGLSPYVGSQNGTKKWEDAMDAEFISSPAIGADGVEAVKLNSFGRVDT